jgi:hypothetical protein
MSPKGDRGREFDICTDSWRALEEKLRGRSSLARPVKNIVISGIEECVDIYRTRLELRRQGISRVIHILT